MGFVPTSGGTPVYAKVAELTAASPVNDGSYASSAAIGTPNQIGASTWVPAVGTTDKKTYIGGVALSLAQTGTNKGEDSIE